MVWKWQLKCGMPPSCRNGEVIDRPWPKLFQSTSRGSSKSKRRALHQFLHLHHFIRNSIPSAFTPQAKRTNGLFICLQSLQAGSATARFELHPGKKTNLHPWLSKKTVFSNARIPNRRPLAAVEHLPSAAPSPSPPPPAPHNHPTNPPPRPRRSRTTPRSPRSSSSAPRRPMRTPAPARAASRRTRR